MDGQEVVVAVQDAMASAPKPLQRLSCLNPHDLCSPRTFLKTWQPVGRAHRRQVSYGVQDIAAEPEVVMSNDDACSGICGALITICVDVCAGICLDFASTSAYSITPFLQSQ